MIVRLSTRSGPEITDRDRTDRLYATVDGAPDALRMEPVCRRCDDRHVWVSVDALRTACTPIVGELAFDEMIAHAGGEGWLDPSGDFVRAHVDTTDG